MLSKKAFKAIATKPKPDLFNTKAKIIMSRIKHSVINSLVLLIIAGCSTAPVSPVVEPIDASALLDQAEAAFSAGDFELAYQLTQNILLDLPSNTEAWELNRRIVIAQAGSQYLEWLPGDRYRISPATFLLEQANGRHFFILDVREPDEFSAGHIEGAVNIPLRELLENIDQLPNKSVPVLIYCRSQKRSTHTLVVLRELGFVQAYNLEGGFIAFQEYIVSNPEVVPGPVPTLPPVSTEGC
jgi:rhodanese-related sulfurtransferase